jgi:predicted amidohydrolase
MPLTVTVLEVPARTGAMDTQLAWIERELGRRKAGEVTVLPEACLTGYVSPDGDFDLAPHAEPLRGRQLEHLTRLAGRFDTTLIGPVIERDGAECFNAAAVVTPEGALLATYRKRHPWMPETWASPSDNPLPAFTLGGLRCSLAICFDVHFLAEESHEVLKTIDVLFYQSAWVDSDGDARPGHLTPLAREFGITIVNANWGRGQPRIAGQGGSMIVRPDGSMHRPFTARFDAVID